ncbi:hypothetical protein SEA_LUMOS_118 [Mycobacterium phage Lumos]|uniref:Uncharacterized protein n=1 Tax=Mycobacterium phage Lumos TaxID=1701852 RepID=A0A0K2CMG4_9CAUD|nr:hypothetical protein AVU96_gp072 [Mycobacterium phage Snenia]YP_010012566.1 hypothetical protein J4T93_gp070 [Mycobacterium phage Lumos]ASM62845.1 hypothetical protein SEA_CLAUTASTROPHE_117 [Mycobacterium phage Clautastrophe]QDF16692.1 hypothetical protein PBI_MSGREEN_119 [Mycobacterium phage MsGreen]QPL14992.1 hypothetical protein SEA_JUBIE_118 [Mycobacterium phage Jubie]ALA06624.1 hypothetical protein SEA_LUMOS_118 [Mycobacterium phage Lumos]ALF01563.1 hypothetical protein SNENIA_117 [My
MYAVWMKDAIDDDRSVLSGLAYHQADRLVKNLTAIMPDAVVWMEEE